MHMKDNIITKPELTYQDLIREEQKKEKYLKKNKNDIENINILNKKNVSINIPINIPIKKLNSFENLKELEKYNNMIDNRHIIMIELDVDNKIEYCDIEGDLGQYVLFVEKNSFYKKL